MKKLLLFTLVLLTHALVWAQSTVENIPNQKLINNSYVSNPDNILSETAVAQIDTILSNLEQKVSVQVAVVAVQSIGDEDIFDFAQKLFNTWAIGQQSNDNGLLLLLVEDKRTIRFHTGYGLEGTLPDVTCKRIQQQYMVPEFKQGDYSAGMVAGIRQIDQILTNPAYAEELMAEEKSSEADWTGFIILLCAFALLITLIVFWVKFSQGTFSDSKRPKPTEYPEMRLGTMGWLAEFVLIPIAIVICIGIAVNDNAMVFALLGVYAYYIITLAHRLIRMARVVKRLKAAGLYYEIVEFLRSGQTYWLFMGLLFPVPFFPYFFYHLARKRAYRNHSRQCKSCHAAMEKLTEKTEDVFLSANQQVEEAIRSVDYDVWKCTGCATTEVWHYPNRYSKYSECPKCHTKAYYRSANRTITSATYSSSGKGEETFTCKACGGVKKKTYSIAKLVASTSGSSSSGGSSSSSGGSWGGGSSGGGGASSSW